MCHLRHTLRITLFHRKVMFHSLNTQIFIFLTISWFTKSVTSWLSISIWDRVHFWIYLLNHNSLIHQTLSIDKYEQEQYFSETFSTIWRTGAMFQALFNLATCPNYSISNYVKISAFQVNKGQLKIVNVNY